MEFTIEDFYDSPFELGKPVSPYKFKGRLNDCKKSFEIFLKSFTQAFRNTFSSLVNVEWARHHLRNMFPILLNITLT